MTVNDDVSLSPKGGPSKSATDIQIIMYRLRQLNTEDAWWQSIHGGVCTVRHPSESGDAGRGWMVA